MVALDSQAGRRDCVALLSERVLGLELPCRSRHEILGLPVTNSSRPPVTVGSSDTFELEMA